RALRRPRPLVARAPPQERLSRRRAVERRGARHGEGRRRPRAGGARRAIDSYAGKILYTHEARRRPRRNRPPGSAPGRLEPSLGSGDPARPGGRFGGPIASDSPLTNRPISLSPQSSRP